MTQSTLDLNNRGHNVECVYESSSLIKKYKIKLGLQMMVGLYGDTIDTVINTAFELCKIKSLALSYQSLEIKQEYIHSLTSYPSIFDLVKVCTAIVVLFYVFSPLLWRSPRERNK